MARPNALDTLDDHHGTLRRVLRQARARGESSYHVASVVLAKRGIHVHPATVQRWWRKIDAEDRRNGRRK